ncbi:restriction endonuclease subunit S [Listeria innocua]
MSHINKRVPKRRFKEFSNADAWIQRILVDEFTFFTGLTYSPNSIREVGTLVLRSSNVQNSEIVDADNIYVEKLVVNSKNVEVGDIVVVVRNGSRSLIGKHAQIKKNMPDTVIGAFMTGITYKVPQFGNALLATSAFKKEIAKNLGATINQITTGMFKQMIFNFPKDVEEQNKIGRFFDGLDNTIVLHQCKLEKIKALKAAYLSEMFPAEGETKPKRRFAGFTDEWEKRELEDVAPLRGGYAFQSEDYQSSGIPIIRISNILSNGSIGGEYTFSKERDKDSKYVLPKGAIILAMSGATTGKTAIVNSNLYKKIYQNQRVGYFVNLNIVDYFFVKVIVESNSFYHQLGAVLIAGAQPNISSKEVGAFEFYFPTKIEEQKKIGFFFQQLDKTITLHQRKLQKLQNIKKAYLNEMFI